MWNIFNIIVNVNMCKNREVIGDGCKFFLKILNFGSLFWRDLGEALEDALMSRLPNTYL